MHGAEHDRARHRPALQVDHRDRASEPGGDVYFSRTLLSGMDRRPSENDTLARASTTADSTPRAAALWLCGWSLAVQGCDEPFPGGALGRLGQVQLLRFRSQPISARSFAKLSWS